jgi:hypothetical protein
MMMRWTAVVDIGRFLLASLPACLAGAVACALFSGAAAGGAITNIAPLTSNAGQALDLSDDQSGPAIEVGPAAPDTASIDLGNTLPSATDARPANSQQPYVPWVVQDRESLDWFGPRDDLLSVDADAPRAPSSESFSVMDQPIVPPSGQADNSIVAFAQPRAKVGTDQSLDTTLTRLVAGFFQSLGYVKTIVVIGPVVILAIIIGMVQLAKILRVSQGLDPEQGRKWGIKRSGQFGRIDEINDNSVRSRRNRDVA